MGLCESTKSNKEIPESDVYKYSGNNENSANLNQNQKANPSTNTNSNANTNNPQKQNPNFHTSLTNISKDYPNGKTWLLRKIQGKDNSTDNLKRVIELYVEITRVPQPGVYSCELTVLEDNSQPLKIASLNPQSSDDSGRVVFADYVEMNYYFERDQHLQIKITESNSNQSTVLRESIAKIASSLKSSCSISDYDFEVQINAKPIKSERKHYTFAINVTDKDNSLTSKQLYLVFSNFNDNKNWRGVYKSEESQNLAFQPVTIAEDDLFLGDPAKKFKIHLLHHAKPYSVGYVETCINDLGESKQLQLIGNDGNLINVFLNSKMQLTEIPNFCELLKQGLQISMMVAVDFTASNGDPKDSGSLHYCRGKEPNQYERAMRSCGNILVHYDNDKKFPLLGFGGIPDGNSDVEFAFPMNYTDDPNVNSIEEMIEVYKSALNKTALSGPTYFAPFLTKLKNFVQSSKGSYFVLMILTDGMINDFKETVEQIIECSYLPISIVIIGVGKADFSQMEMLDGDDMPLTDSKGNAIARDIVQFVPYKKFEKNPKQLSEQVLRELPGQIELFYTQTKSI